MKPKPGFTIIVLFLLLFQANSVWVLITATQNKTLYSTIITTAYILIALLVFIERKNLEKFNLDRPSLFIFIFTTFVRMKFLVVGEIWYLSIIAITGLLCGFVILTNWSSIPKSNFRWVGIGLIAGMITAIPISVIQVISGYLTTFENHISSLPIGLVLFNRVNYTLSFVSPLEEILLRGFLWGYLIKMGFSENRACITQAFIFWLVHWNRLGFPLVFFVALPIMTYVISRLRSHSKEIFPSLVAHTMINALVDTTMIVLRWNNL